MRLIMRATPEYGYDIIAEHYNNKLSKMENARKLHEIDPTKSVKGWEMSIYRWLRNEQIVPIENTTPLTPSINKSYHYDEINDVYYTFLTIADKMIPVDGEKHRAMKEAYSNMVGKAASMNEITREFGIPRAWFDEYRRRHGWTHDMSPYTDEEVASTDIDQLVEDLVLKRKHLLHEKFERRKWKDIEEAAEKYEMFNSHVLNEFKQLVGETPTETPKLEMAKGEDYSLVISPTDFHWGKYGWVDEVGETYNFNEARKRLMEKTAELLCRLPSRPEQIILATGSDWFHVDTDAGTTTKGTPQDMCGSPAEILMSGCQLAREHIDLLRQIAPVKVVFMPGNHDRMSAISLMMYLSAVYENVEDCEVVVSPSTRQYVQYGNNLLGFIHGDGAKNLVDLMSNEQRKLWGECEHHTWFHGHLHHRQVLEKGGCLIVQLPSLAGHDRYHARQGYTTSKAGLAAHLIDKQKGLIATFFAPVEGEH